MSELHTAILHSQNCSIQVELCVEFSLNCVEQQTIVRCILKSYDKSLNSSFIEEFSFKIPIYLH